MQTQEAVGLLCGYGVYVLVCASFNTVLAAMARRSGGAEGSLLADQSGKIVNLPAKSVDSAALLSEPKPRS